MIRQGFGIDMPAFISNVGKRLSAAETLRRYAEPLKAELRKLIVSPAEKVLADFDAEHAKDLPAIIELQQGGEEPFTPRVLPIDHFQKPGPSPEVMAAVGNFSKPAA